jgi:predicted tellurium resistance membrane protein TerC
MLDWLMTVEGWAALLALTAMEIVLGIDNIVFISVLVSRLPPEQAERARKFGLLMALVFRIALLFAITWLIALRAPVFSVFGHAMSWRDVILLAGGLFLIFKATHELYEMSEPDLVSGAASAPVGLSLFGAVAQIAVIDLVFSIDSIIMAIGMVQNIAIMVTAVVIAVIVMYIASGPVARFVAKHPTTKTLALAFLILIGVALCAEAAGDPIPRGYIYFAMAFSASIQLVNIAVRSRTDKKRAVKRPFAPT